MAFPSLLSPVQMLENLNEDATLQMNHVSSAHENCCRNVLLIDTQPIFTRLVKNKVPVTAMLLSGVHWGLENEGGKSSYLPGDEGTIANITTQLHAGCNEHDT